MDGKTYICERCGGTVRIGDFPICHGNPSEHGPWVGAEEPLSPYFDEMISTDGAEITSRGQRRQIMRENHLEYRSKAKAPGKTIFLDMGRRG